jgi:8-oxo-dGTP pyrophosphatase MutT (NUDIX family)
LQEEVGVGVKPDELHWIEKLSPDARTGFEFTTLYWVSSAQQVVLDPDEIDDGRWLLPAELDAWIIESPAQFTDVFRIIWPLVRAHRFG